MRRPTLRQVPLRVFHGTRLHEVLQDEKRIAEEVPIAIRSAVGAYAPVTTSWGLDHVKMCFRVGDGPLQGVRVEMRDGDQVAATRAAERALLLAVVPSAPAYAGQFEIEPLHSGDVAAE